MMIYYDKGGYSEAFEDCVGSLRGAHPGEALQADIVAKIRPRKSSGLDLLVR
jgi:hypothetical protein